ncbi:MAG TPA: NADH-quinone oxidoreductase subunit L, partial [Acidimicrobiales bacterium]|nr:NADH-quinone oxidoreductase subunit L [Acidimicrobiales bacterium]
MLQATAFIPALPLAGFLILLVAGRRLGDPKAGWVATCAIVLSFIATLVAFVGLMGHDASNRVYVESLFAWIPLGSLHVDVAFQADPLSVTMALFVTGVSSLIHLYAIGYMKRDRDFPKFFLYFNLFVFSMLMLVLAGNFVLTFLGWEGVGACSYFLISYFFERDSAATAGKFAFIVNRIGDFGFLLAMFLIFEHTGTLSFKGAFAAAPHLSSGTTEAVCLLLFLGAVGKSAQLPLSLWLADAMEGPTPVSALIHAATMVTAGVYLMARVSPLLSHAPVASWVVCGVGVATAFVAATIGTSQDDIKKVLAYSTVSQLGFMFLAVGSGAYVAAIFLMVTHAFYKALLFLGSGSVIHAMGDEQNIKKMGGLRRFMPITGFTFIIGWLAIAGVPPFSGFWSKGDVLDGAYVKSPVLWAFGALAAILTAYYMGREVYLVFFGEPRWEKAAAGTHAGDSHSAGDPHEPTWLMWLPLVVLAGCATFAGILNLPFTSGLTFLDKWLNPVFGNYSAPLALSTSGKWALALTDAVLALAGVGIAASLWLRRWDRPSLEPEFLQNSWGLYVVYDYLVSKPSQVFANFASTVVENKVIDAAVNSTGT